MLLERERELDIVAGALAGACEGEGSFVLVEGETGVGKSRLLIAAEDRAFDLDMATLVARGTELDADLPFGVVIQLVERLVTALPRPERDELLEGPASMAAPLFPALRKAGEPAAEDPLALVHGAYWLIARIGELRPLLITVDDAQWIDERSLQVLRYLAARIEDLPIALVAAGTTSAVEELARHAAPIRLTLRPLSSEGVARVVLSEFPDADAQFCAACAQASAGVPLLLSELLAAVRTNGLSPTGATTAGFERLGLREVARAVLSRLEALPSGTPVVARTAAVLGDDAELHYVARLAELSLHEAAVALDALCASGIVEPDETIRFRHPAVRAALEASVPPAGRARTHLAAAHLLLGDAAPPERVAGHLVEAERGGRRWVVETLRRAATRAMGDGAPASAARYLDRALAEPPGHDVHGEVLIELARAEAAAGSPQAPARIRAALEPVTDADERTRVLADLVQVPSTADRPAVVGAFEDGLRLAHDRGADPEAMRWLEATLLAEARDDAALRCRARGLLGISGEPHDDTQAGRALTAQRALEAALDGRPAGEVRGLAERALGRGALLAEDRPGGPHVAAAIRALALADDLQSAELAAAVAVDRARESGSPDAYARVSALRADVSLRRGSLADAVADARAALEVPAAMRQRTAVAALALALLEHGDTEEAAETLAGADLDGATAAGSAAVLCARARLRRMTGDLDGAAGDARAAGELAIALQADVPAWLPWRSELALALLDADPAEARRVAAEELGLAMAFGAPRATGVALRVSGLAEGGEEGLQLLRESVTVLEGSHAALERAHARADLGSALRAARDPVAARGPLREALAIARRAGAIMLEQRILVELAAAGDRVRVGGRSDADLLTPAERRVVDLATDGLSADEVADALFITVKAVEWHLRSASRKLGARSRDQLLSSLSLRQ